MKPDIDNRTVSKNNLLDFAGSSSPVSRSRDVWYDPMHISALSVERGKRIPIK
jgi:hypothetical protein